MAVEALGIQSSEYALPMPGRQKAQRSAPQRGEIISQRQPLPSKIQASRAALNPSNYSRYLAILAVLAYYLWASTAFNDFSPNGYYNYLARGLAAGHLYLPIEVNPLLLAQPNPYDPSVPDELKMHDMALYKGRYFLYHGPAPALLAFLPYRLLSNRDMPEAIAVFLFVSLGFLANSITLSKLNPQAGPLLYLALGLANCIPFLLHRIFVYEVAIACGYACLSAAFALYFYNRHVLAGLFFGLAFLARPHLALALLFVGPRCWPSAAIAILASLTYNYLRFDSPLEFGLHYLIAGVNQQAPNFAAANLLPSLYLFLLEPPVWINRFPWLEIKSLTRIALPPTFFHENIMGALWLSPFLLCTRPQVRLALTGLGLLLFLSSTGWVTQRYLVDFLPLLVLAALSRKAPALLQNTLILCGLAFNFLLHIQGPYNAP